ncbi:MAG: EAL domain-containing protein [Myxococcota bacterium]|nr:EAL domain-containing protein [Myxococcota bacterium]
MTQRRRLLIPPDTTVDLDRREVIREGRRLRLTALETRLLLYLWEQEGTVVPSEELLVEVWGHPPGTQTRALDSAIRRLRHKLEPEPAAPVHLVGIYGKGYLLSGSQALDTAPETERASNRLPEITQPGTGRDERDPLTGLLCRSALLDRLDRSLDHDPNQALAVLVCSIDRLRHVNASMGLEAGDALLARSAERLRAAAQPHLVGRFSGNAFVIVIGGKAGPEEALQLAERLLREIEPPFELAGRWCHVGLNIGAAFATSDGGAEALVRNAALALEEAEQTGPGRVVLFDRALAERTTDQADIEAALSAALEQDELALHYQPIFELPSGRLVAFEALLRWRRPGFGLVGPDRFIPVAERSGLIARLQEWVLPRAFSELAQLDHGGTEAPQIWINVSGRTLNRPDIAVSTERWLKEAGVPGHRVTLELTETGLLRDEEAAARTLQELRAIGVQLAIDDFGTGYASLSHLVRFPVNILKIDKSFVAVLGEIDERNSIASTIIELGRHFGLQVVAEGVERRSQLTALQRLGCPLVQGNLLCPPAPADALAGLAQQHIDPELLPKH